MVPEISDTIRSDSVAIVVDIIPVRILVFTTNEFRPAKQHFQPLQDPADKP